MAKKIASKLLLTFKMVVLLWFKVCVRGCYVCVPNVLDVNWYSSMFRTLKMHIVFE